ncbi:hypothetical protein IEQ34_009504 [Dendrobium chrysotoxum]|uniref:TNase-like domain-containing protein n=1 Tax=Dendrobium chrysotoxum TaxID=161865 RepID=A0AAV7H2M0_DENCH|nr:hypothetical protein IEQ34_009504 [Dendrobium chrysotoxum]
MFSTNTSFPNRFLNLPNQQEVLSLLVKMIQGKCLKIHVYDEDIYGRCVGDVYCNDIFIQKQLLKRGCLQKEASDARTGLWALPDPKKPREWRRNNPNPQMENAMRLLYGFCQRPIVAYEPQVLGSHGLTIIEIVEVATLAVDLRHFDITSQVFIGLSQYMSSSMKEQATLHFINTNCVTWHYLCLQRFLAFYGLPYVPQTIEEDIEVTITRPEGITPPLPEGVQFELLTLPVDKRAIGDGDGFTAYVSITEPRELKLTPQKVRDAIIRMENARDAKDFKQAKLIKKSVVDSGYRFLNLPNQQEVLARKYRIRLRGVDAPEVGMAYGEEAKQVLVKMIQGKCLKIHVYNEDTYGRSVGDVYYNDIFIQEQLLKRGCVWHYVAYDRRPEFAKWQKEARDARRGLWALPDPEKPWEWRRNNPNPRERRREATILFTNSDSGFLTVYGLPYVSQTIEEDIEVTTTRPEGITPPLPEGVQFELLTLPVDKKAIGDGDDFAAYISITEPRELKLMPQKVIDAIIRMENALYKDFHNRVSTSAQKLSIRLIIIITMKMMSVPNNNEVDAPEVGMTYGEEAKQVLVKIIQGKCLKIHVYDEDRYGRSVGDVYCNDIFIHEQLLKRDCVWYYVAYDHRQEFWQKEACDAHRGLWALPDPEKQRKSAEEKHLVIALLSYLDHPKLRRDGKCYETYLWILPKAYNSLLGSHGLTIIEIVGVTTLVVDMRHFDITSQVPTGLSQHNKLLKAWNEDWPPPKQPEVATMLVIQTLYIIGFLTVYGLPYVSQTIEEDIEVTTIRPEGITPPLPEGVQFDDAIWGKKEKGNSAFEKSDVENIFCQDKFSHLMTPSTTSQ